jgi:hypothetical protein
VVKISSRLDDEGQPRPGLSDSADAEVPAVDRTAHQH